MAGHSKWAQIKHKKTATDAKKSQIFSKLSALITVAAREKGPNPELNPKLRMAIEKARAFNMPQENIERAIKRGIGQGEGAQLEELLIEAYGPGGRPLLIQAITDNKNRTLNEIRHILNNFQGKMATSGSVRWLFTEKGKFLLQPKEIKEEEELKIIEAGAEDIQIKEDQIVILTKPDNFEKMKKTLLELNFQFQEEPIIEFIPKTTEKISEEEKKIYENLFEALDNQNEVEEIYSNLEF